MEAKCCMLPRAHSGAKETQNVLLLMALCPFFCLQVKSEKRCASRTQLTAATAMQLSRLESPLDTKYLVHQLSYNTKTCPT